MVIICGLFLLHIASSAFAATDGQMSIYDKTYIDAKVNELTTSDSNIIKRVDSVETATNQKIKEVQDSMVFKIVELTPGQIVIGGASTEIIVRTKNAVTAYCSESASGGISNLISGKDLKPGAIVPDNQLLLIPRDDGRGIKANQKAFIMIKGTYTIK